MRLDSRGRVGVVCKRSGNIYRAQPNNIHIRANTRQFLRLEFLEN